jgi:predicted metal-dependent phosphoesterase TrpH
MPKAGGSARVRFERPQDAEGIDGMAKVDMHFHSRASDGKGTPSEILKQARRLGIGVAITDHNHVIGNIEAYLEGGAMVVPGMEVSALDGPHILTYFHSVGDLREFHTEVVYPRLGHSPFLAISLDSDEIIDAAKERNAVCVAAHPFGYFMMNKGVSKCVRKGCIPQEVEAKLDGLEVICGSMGRTLNLRAEAHALAHGKAMTGGTDGHLVGDLGGVVTCCHAENARQFLDEVLGRRSTVVGLENGAARKIMTGTHMAAAYAPYLVPSLAMHYRQNAPRLVRAFRPRSK